MDLSGNSLDDSDAECLCSNWLSWMTKLTYLKLNLRIKFGNEVRNSGATSLDYNDI